ncbi:hypothetical protein BDN71DRAFT_1228158 [Pleurotus eryngii]|uniref:Uncharacterized protein n=1 Tax=Pleurotus eryngii TaxID=5323 RepID=A0A9P5ZRF2_PLEER|nr:hypothetical protein BDN71DRAFT_1228158 [Pleurotus eryngii]
MCLYGAVGLFAISEATVTDEPSTRGTEQLEFGHVFPVAVTMPSSSIIRWACLCSYLYLRLPIVFGIRGCDVKLIQGIPHPR